ncbi:MAG: response regulator [Lentisphaeraceae bacterium]|nr:response regulator [Lentisphaeraceae bacterium]
MTRVMVIEDDHHLAALIKEYFQNLDIDVEINYNAMTALRQLKSEKFDLVLTDINMSPMSGFELIQDVRAFNKDIKIVAMSGSYISTEGNLNHLKKELTEAGMSSFLQKPFIMDDIKQVLRDCGLYSQPA